jgi:alpha-beta hydrolase superfamily lysophospholipase
VKASDPVVEPLEIRAAAGRKQPIYFGAAGRPLFGFYHPPQGPSWRAVGVVMCNPIGTDQTRSDRVYRHLAERLAEAGFAVLRFDLFGTGDSGGDGFPAGVVRSWVDDVRVAAEELRRRSGARATALFGLRLGATLAFQHAAESGAVESLVLWNPCVSGKGFVTEVTRLHKMYLRIEPQMASAVGSSADGEEALGLFLPRAMVDELSQIDLLQASRKPAARTLVLDGGGNPAAASLVERVRALGGAADVQAHPGHKFLITVSHRSVVPDEPIDAIVAWLSEAHAMTSGAAAAADGVPPLPSQKETPANERAVVFRAGGKALFGVVTPADGASAKPGRPAIVLTNAGCVNRSGPQRLYTTMARRWAKLGFDVLRVDLSGIGDSPVAAGERENLTYPAGALDELRAATRVLGRDRAVIAGLCSGGDYAFQLGAHDPNVVGALLLNPRTFCVLDLTAVESGVPPATPVEDVPRALAEMAARGVETMIIVSRNDPGVAYVDAHASDAMRALVGKPGYHRVDLDGTDHSFTPVTTQKRVSDLLTEHLAARY